MSSEIFYSKAYIRVDNRFIPLVCQGSSNVFEYNAMGRLVAERYWNTLNAPYRGRFVFSKEEIEHIADVYEEFSVDSGGGIKKSRNRAFEKGEFRAWILAGVQQAKTVEEYIELGNCLEVYYGKSGWVMSVMSTSALLALIDGAEDKNSIRIAFRDNRTVIRRKSARQVKHRV